MTPINYQQLTARLEEQSESSSAWAAAVGGPGDPVACLDRVLLYVYAGELAQLRSAAQALLGTAP